VDSVDRITVGFQDFQTIVWAKLKLVKQTRLEVIFKGIAGDVKKVQTWKSYQLED